MNEVIGIVKKKLGEIKSERVSERSDADEMLVRKKIWKLVGAVGRESGDLGGGGKGRH